MTNLPNPLQFEVVVELGQIVISAEASKEFSLNELFDVLHSQATGDWGTIDSQELDWNEYAVKWGGELLSRYGTPERKLIVITDDSRSETQQHNVTNVYTDNEY
jgi:hypothetical protein